MDLIIYPHPIQEIRKRINRSISISSEDSIAFGDAFLAAQKQFATYKIIIPSFIGYSFSLLAKCSSSTYTFAVESSNCTFSHSFEIEFTKKSVFYLEGHYGDIVFWNLELICPDFDGKGIAIHFTCNDFLIPSPQKIGFSGENNKHEFFDFNITFPLAKSLSEYQDKTNEISRQYQLQLDHYSYNSRLKNALDEVEILLSKFNNIPKEFSENFDEFLRKSKQIHNLEEISSLLNLVTDFKTRLASGFSRHYSLKDKIKSHKESGKIMANSGTFFDEIIEFLENNELVEENTYERFLKILENATNSSAIAVEKPPEQTHIEL